MRGNILHSSDLLPNDRIVSYSRREETKQYFKHHQEHASSFCIQVGCFLDLTCTCAPVMHFVKVITRQKISDARQVGHVLRPSDASKKKTIYNIESIK